MTENNSGGGRAGIPRAAYVVGGVHVVALIVAAGRWLEGDRLFSVGVLIAVVGTWAIFALVGRTN